ncbi:MAG: cupin domain-containing protein [Nocardioides sp.]
MHALLEAGRFTATGTAHYAEHLRVADLSCGTYSIPAGGEDPQSPHTEDELYVCTAGRATLWTPGGSTELTPGVVTFVPAGEEHRFVEVGEDFAVLVVFGPAEGSRGSAE